MDPIEHATRLRRQTDDEVAFEAALDAAGTSFTVSTGRFYSTASGCTVCEIERYVYVDEHLVAVFTRREPPRTADPT